MKAFSPIEKIERDSFFVSREIKSIIRRGVRAARNHEILVLDAEHGVGATITLEALKLHVRTDPTLVLVELAPHISMSQNTLWHEVLLELGEKPAWRWSDWKDKQGKVRQGRQKQLGYKLGQLSAQGKYVLITVDNALSTPHRIWELLRVMATQCIKGYAYGPGVVLVANLRDRTAFHKPEDIVAEGKENVPNLVRRTSLKMGGLTPTELDPYIRFQAARDGIELHPRFVSDLKRALQNRYLQVNGLSRFPGHINVIALNLLDESHHLGKPITQRVQTASSPKARARV